MKKAISLIVIVLTIVIISTLDFNFSKPVSKLTIPENTIHFVIGCEGSHRGEKNFIYYFSEEGTLLGKEFISNDYFDLLYANEGFIYSAAQGGIIQEVNLSTGEIKGITKRRNSSTQIGYLERKGDLLFFERHDYKITNSTSELCILDLRNNNEKCITQSEHSYDGIFFIDQSLFVLESSKRYVVEYDFDLNELRKIYFDNDSQGNREMYVLPDENNIYVIYENEIHDLFNDKWYDSSALNSYSIYRIINGEAVAMNERTYTYNIVAYDLESKKIVRKIELENYYFLDNVKNVFVNRYYTDSEKVPFSKAAVIRFDFGTFEFSEIELVIESEEKNTVIERYYVMPVFLHTYQSE